MQTKPPRKPLRPRSELSLLVRRRTHPSRTGAPERTQTITGGRGEKSLEAARRMACGGFVDTAGPDTRPMAQVQFSWPEPSGSLPPESKGGGTEQWPARSLSRAAALLTLSALPSVAPANSVCDGACNGRDVPHPLTPGEGNPHAISRDPGLETCVSRETSSRRSGKVDPAKDKPLERQSRASLARAGTVLSSSNVSACD